MPYSHDPYCQSPKMTAYNSPFPSVVTESNYTEWYRGWLALNQSGSGGPWYYGSTAGNQWIKLDVGEGNSITINKYTLTSTSNNASYPGMPIEWKLQGSNNDSDWTDLDYRSDETGWGNSEMRSYSFSNATAYRYHKILMITKEAGIFGWQLSEIELINPDIPPPAFLNIFNIFGQAEFTDSPVQKVFAINAQAEYTDTPNQKLFWLFAQAEYSETAAILVPKPDDLTMAMSIDGSLVLVPHTPLVVQDLTLAMSIDGGLTLVPHEVTLSTMGRFFLLFD